MKKTRELTPKRDERRSFRIKRMKEETKKSTGDTVIFAGRASNPGKPLPLPGDTFSNKGSTDGFIFKAPSDRRSTI